MIKININSILKPQMWLYIYNDTNEKIDFKYKIDISILDF